MKGVHQLRSHQIRATDLAQDAPSWECVMHRLGNVLIDTLRIEGIRCMVQFFSTVLRILKLLELTINIFLLLRVPFC